MLPSGSSKMKIRVTVFNLPESFLSVTRH